MIKVLPSAGAIAGLLLSLVSFAENATEHGDPRSLYRWDETRPNAIQLGPRPAFLIKQLNDGALKEKLLSCQSGPFRRSQFSIGHRGAPMHFPEHTRESYEAAAVMGAGIIECDVTFTRDKELVCRHSQCDLHTTTNILTTDLAEKCSEPFRAAQFDRKGNLLKPASAKCCTSDITLAEFKTLEGKMDSANSRAQTTKEYLRGRSDSRGDIHHRRGTLMTHAESIELFKKLGVSMTPELKSPSVVMPFHGFSQQDYAQKLVDEYRAAGVPDDRIWPQSFNYEDIKYWIEKEPDFAQQAVLLDGRYALNHFDHRDPRTWQPTIPQLVADGVRIVAPPMWMLLEAEDGAIVPSVYAKAIRSAGIDIITWSLERSGPLSNGGGWYYQTLNSTNTLNEQSSVIKNDSDMLVVLHVLASEVGVLGVFSDWPATTTYYANCMDLK